MEENCDVQMETDVSSTTEDLLDTQEVTDSNGQMETTTIKKKDIEETNSSLPNETQAEKTNSVTPASIVIGEKHKELPFESTAKSPDKKAEDPKPTQKSPVKIGTPLKVISIISPVKTPALTTTHEVKTGSADSSTKGVSSPNKPQVESSPCKVEKSPRKDEVPKKVHIRSPVKLTIRKSLDKKPLGPNKNLFQKSIRDITLQHKLPTNNKKSQLQVIKSPFQVAKSPQQVAKSPQQVAKSPQLVAKSPQQVISPIKETDTTPKTSEEKPGSISQKSSPPVKLVRKSKVVQLHGTTITLSSAENSTKIQPSTSTPELDIKVVKVYQSPATKVDKVEELPPSTDIPMDSSAMEEASNDSQLSSTASDKEHKSGISRELKSLINSAKESKIINECTHITSKTRKSRTNLDNSLNTSVEADSIKVRRISTSSQADSDKPGIKRSMRSQNPDFVTKCKQFLNSVTSKVMKDSDETQSEDDQEEGKQKVKIGAKANLDSAESTPKKKKASDSGDMKNKTRSDPFCWKCHWAIEENLDEKLQVYPSMNCSVCVRTYHVKCLSIENRKASIEKSWVCPECLQIMHAEGSETRSPSMKKISLGMLCDLLKFALERMTALAGVEPFLQPVDRSAFPDYDDVVVHPMDLSQISRNIADGRYGSREAFVADTQWILHNSILFNACEQTFTHSKLTAAARALVRTCRSEMTEIETCPECYAGAHSRNLTYFTEVCSTPHMLLWAKLKGFPYWPAKAMSINQTREGWMVDVRFFGQHDKAWLPIYDCYLYSEKDPNTNKNKHTEILACRQEVDVHIRNICRKYGSFVYAPFKTIFDHNKMTEQLKLMIPSFDGVIKSMSTNSPLTKDKSRYSKSSKCSSNDGDMSESEESSVKSRKNDEDDDVTKDDMKLELEEKDQTLEADSFLAATLASRKRRRSVMPESTTPSADVKAQASRKRRRSVMPESTTPSSDVTAQKKKKVDDKSDDKKLESTPKKTETLNKPESAPKKPELTAKKPEPATKKQEPAAAKNPETVAIKPELAKKPEVPKKQEIEPKNAEAVPKKPEQDAKKPEEASSSQNNKKEIVNNKANVDGNINKIDEKKQEKEVLNTTFEEKEGLRVTPIRLVALPRQNNLTPKLFTTAKITKATPEQSTPKTPAQTSNTSTTLTDDDEADKHKKKKITKADKFIISEQVKDANKARRRSSTNSRSASRSSRNSRNRSLTTSTPKSDKSDKKSDSGSDASSKDAKTNKKIDTPDKSIIKRVDQKAAKEEKGTADASEKRKKKIDASLAAVAREFCSSSSGLPTITSVCSLSTTGQKTSSVNTTTKVSSMPKTIEITVEANSDSSIFTPTSTNNVGNMKEAVSKLQKLRNDTEPFVGRVGVKAFARMTSPDINDDVQVEIKPEPIDIDEIDEERQIEKMDLMNACRLQPVNQNQTLREVRMNKVVCTPSLLVKKGVKANEPRPRAKKTFPQPKRPDDGRSELNGKNSMVYIPIQPPMTQAPMRSGRPGALPGVVMPASVTAGPRLPPPVTCVNSLVNTVTTPLRPTTSTLTSPPPLQATPHPIGPITMNQVPTVGPTTVHTVPLMTSVNGQWMFSLQPMMSVGGVDSASSPPMVNGVNERPSTTLLPVTSSSSTSAVVMPSLGNRVKSNSATNTTADNGTPGEMPRLMQRPLLSPFDANTPIGSVPPPSTAGPITARLNQNAVKLTDFFRTLLEDSIERLDEPLAQVAALKVQLEQARWRHQQNIDELKHNHELTLSEIRQSCEKEKVRAVSEARRTAQIELEAAIKETKSKQWCINCSQEAHFYCCWNTSYCDYTCQREHWTTHQNSCTQSSNHPQQTDQEIRRTDMPILDRPEVTVTTSHHSTRANLPTTQSLDELNLAPQPLSPFHILQNLKLRDTAGASATLKRDQQTSPMQILQNLKSRDLQATITTVPKRDQLIIVKKQRTVDQEPRPREQGQRPIQQQTIPEYKKRMADSWIQDANTDKDAPESRLQQDNLPKNAPPTPTLTVGGKLAPSRVFTDNTGSPKTSIIVSMVEDPSGNQTIKCLGTYKPPQQAQAGKQASPLLINKQLANEDNAGKKVVTSGGYLIVGAGTTASVITPASATRRPHIYYTHT